MKLKPVFTCSFSNIRHRIQQDDLVTVRTHELTPFPTDCNPFHHDSFSMGTDLPRSWIVMSSGFDSENGFEEFYLVNTKTGQRIQLDFEPKEPNWQDEVYIEENPALDTNAIYCWHRNGETVEWFNFKEYVVVGKYAILKSSPLYVVIDKWMVRIELVADPVRFAKWVETVEPSLVYSQDAVNMAMKWVAATAKVEAEETKKQS